MIKVAVTKGAYTKGRAIYQEASEYGLDCFEAPEEEAELCLAIKEAGASHAIVGVKPYLGELYQTLPKGAVLARFGVGHDSIDKGKATKAGIICTNTPGVLEDAVAELTIALLTGLARHLVHFTIQLKQGLWDQMQGYHLRGKTLAVIGCGSIGRRVAQIAKKGFEMQVVGCKQTITPAVVCDLQDNFGFDQVTDDFEEAVQRADFVSLHIPASEGTKQFLNKARIELLKSGVILINTARGSIVDEIALFEALQTGKIAMAGLDVFTNEPYQPVSPRADLRKLDNVILTPHVGIATPETIQGMAKKAVDNIRYYLAGEYAKMNILNPEVLV
ncbi:MAG TPA: hypothetical protein ENN77_02010 [Candidatus Wirthbacteria bacterium]|nr:hypothetical protein [Candidatus Wirthbacteria bacterium]